MFISLAIMMAYALRPIIVHASRIIDFVSLNVDVRFSVQINILVANAKVQANATRILAQLEFLTLEAKVRRKL